MNVYAVYLTASTSYSNRGVILNKHIPIPRILQLNIIINNLLRLLFFIATYGERKDT